MTQKKRLELLLHFFLQEQPYIREIPLPPTIPEQKRLLRGLVNRRPPQSVPEEILALEDAYLQEELQGKITDFHSLSPREERIYLWQGDICTLKIDGIVNAANSGMLGCFYPNHSCIDNFIHSFSGVRLRLACAEIMEKQGTPEETGKAKITQAFNLPSKFILHTVGPIVHGTLENSHKQALISAYQSCLTLATKNSLDSLAFCCISTGEFHFPQEEACEIAVSQVRNYLKTQDQNLKVVFNVFKDEDLKLYEEKL